MNIVVNGEEKQLRDGITIEEALVLLKFQSSHLAVALNQSCVPKSKYNCVVLSDGDDIEILAPMAGG